MRVGWSLFGLQLYLVALAFLALQLQFHGCVSLNSEGLSLLAFRSKVETDPFAALQDWDLRDDDPCKWNGVHCVDDRVETLNLRGLKLGGTLTPELGKLNHLKALVLSANNFTGTIPNGFGGLLVLEILDLRSNNLNGPIPVEIRNLPSLKRLLLCDNKFEGVTPWMHKISKNIILKIDQNLPCDVSGDINCLNRKFGHCIQQVGFQNLNKAGPSVIPLLLKGKFLYLLDFFSMSNLKSKRSHGYGGKIGESLSEDTAYTPHHVHDFFTVRRHLLQESKNLLAAPAPMSNAPLHAVSVPSYGSGSFAAIPSPSLSGSRKARHTDGFVSVAVPPATLAKLSKESESTSWLKWIYMVIIPVTASILFIIMIVIVAIGRGTSAIGPWRSGLSGDLGKAFVTGVQKLKRAELEAACEEFSNIIITYPNCTVFKGTLSTGVEVAVVSTKATSLLDWSERSEYQFRNKIDTISKIRHKNFINLVGYCQEDNPFMRMMVFEYAPNGSLFEHLHVRDFEHLDWSARERIIMGIAYCLQHMHEMNPPVVHPILHSSSIFLTDDYAAKIADLGIFSEPVGPKKGFFHCNEDYNLEPIATPESNVYSFGILLLEIISGRMPICEDDGLPILDWVAGCLNDRKSIHSLVDPSLMSVEDDALEVILKVAEACIHEDHKSRPTMGEVTALLRQAIRIPQEAASPRLSPLWWAELEILSLEVI